MSYPVPMLHIEVEGVKHSIIQALSDHEGEFNRIITEELERINITAVIQARVRMEIPRMIDRACDEALEKIGKELASEAFHLLGPFVRAAYANAAKKAWDDRGPG